MHCPACKSKLFAEVASGIQVDVCRDGCGGVWFDAGELDRVDEASEAFPEALLRVRDNSSVVIDFECKRFCPRCADEPSPVELFRLYYDKQNRVEVDTCPKCHGHWLDIGELLQIRELNENELKREAIYQNFLRPATRVNDDRRVRAIMSLIFK